MYGIQHEVTIKNQKVIVQVVTTRGNVLTFDDKVKAEEFICSAMLINGKVIDNLDCPNQSVKAKR